MFEPAFNRRLLASGPKKRRRQGGLSLSELMTLTVLFHQIRFRQFKGFYLGSAILILANSPGFRLLVCRFLEAFQHEIHQGIPTVKAQVAG